MRRKIGVTFLVTLIVVSSFANVFANETIANQSLTEKNEMTENVQDTSQSGTDTNTTESLKVLLPVASKVAKAGTVRAIVANGTIGTVDWTLDSDGVLNFGAGEFPNNYSWTALGNVVKGDTLTVNFAGPVIAGNTLHQMFAGYTKLTTINGLEKLNTSNVVNMANMFASCSSLTNLDLSNFDTSKVTDMLSMFNGCTKLENLDVSNFDTTSVTKMGYMFYNARSLTELNLSSFNTRNVSDMSYMFYNCSNLWKLDIRRFDTNFVTNMTQMFFLVPIKELVLGVDFEFKYSNHSLRAPLNDDQYTGNWKLVETGDVLTNAELLAYDGTKPGTYIWQRVAYNVTYNSNGGSAVTGATVENNAKVTEPINPTKTGYAFDGWYKEAGLINEWDFTTDLMPANNITLYAKWRINSYDVTYDTNGGSGVAGETVEYNSALTQQANPTKAGYTFDGWYKEAGFINEWDFTTDLMPANNITLYAKWRINSYDVTYDTNGGSGVAGETVEYNSALTQQANPTKTGYIFDGWYKEIGLINKWDFLTDLMPANDVTLYAKWKAAEYQIIYNLDGGTNSSNNPSTYEFGVGVANFEDPTKDGYKFLGWFKSSNGGINVTGITATEQGDQTLYARWEKAGTSVTAANIETGSGTGDTLSVHVLASIWGISAVYLIVRKRKNI